MDIACTLWPASPWGKQRAGEELKGPSQTWAAERWALSSIAGESTCSCFLHCELHHRRIYQAERGGEGRIQKKWGRRGQDKQRYINRPWWGNGHLAQEALPGWDGGPGLLARNHNCFQGFPVVLPSLWNITFHLIQAQPIHQNVFVIDRGINTYLLPKFPEFLLDYWDIFGGWYSHVLYVLVVISLPGVCKDTQREML